jgi:hypothetical protein
MEKPIKPVKCWSPEAERVVKALTGKKAYHENGNG